jgi:hypothetical protein
MSRNLCGWHCWGLTACRDGCPRATGLSWEQIVAAEAHATVAYAPVLGAATEAEREAAARDIAQRVRAALRAGAVQAAMRAEAEARLGCAHGTTRMATEAETAAPKLTKPEALRILEELKGQGDKPGSRRAAEDAVLEHLDDADVTRAYRAVCP